MSRSSLDVEKAPSSREADRNGETDHDANVAVQVRQRSCLMDVLAYKTFSSHILTLKIFYRGWLVPMSFHLRLWGRCTEWTAFLQPVLVVPLGAGVQVTARTLLMLRLRRKTVMKNFLRK